MTGADLERYRSGQTGQTVNLLAQPSEVRILPSPPRCIRAATERSAQAKEFGSNHGELKALLPKVSKIGEATEFKTKLLAGRANERKAYGN